MSDSAKPRTVKWPIKVWFVLHVALITCWCLPAAPDQVRRGRQQGTPLMQFLKRTEKVRDIELGKMYVRRTGLWQYWNMFAPDPMNTDFWFSATLRYEDGTEKSIELQRMSKMGFFEKYLAERHRKFLERMKGEAMFAWDGWAQRIALDNTIDPKNRVIGVRCIIHERLIPPPGNPLPTRFDEQYLFDYTPDLELIRRAKGWPVQ